jgi:hypothetical protein
MTGQPLSLVLAAFSVVGAIAFVLICAGSTALGILLAKRLGRRPGAPEVSLRLVREGMRRSRSALREQLTPVERLFFYGYALVSPLLAPIGVGLLVFGRGGMRGVGIGLLLVALVVLAIPISPFMRARIRRREQSASDRR